MASKAIKIDPSRSAVSEGMRARNAEQPFTACPYDSFCEANRVAKAHWLYGWRFRDDEIKKDAAKPRDKNGRIGWQDK